MERPTKVVELRRKLLTTVAPEEIKKAIKELANVYSGMFLLSCVNFLVEENIRGFRSFIPQYVVI